MTTRHTSIRTLLTVAVIIAMFLSDVPINMFMQILRDQNVVDTLWLAQHDINVVDSLGPSIAQAAESAVDSAVNTTLNKHRLNPALVFTGDQTGYMFYVDTSGRCGYAKTTDGGTNWGAFQQTTAQTDCSLVAVWYDQWTPGDTGTVIHLAFNETSGDDVYYDTVDTNGDVQGTEADIRQPVGALTNADPVSITKATNGSLYVASEDGSTAETVQKCSSSCATAGNWTTTSSFTTDTADDSLRLVPLSGGNIMLLRDDISAEDIQSKVYVPGTDTWDAAWTTLDANAADSTTYRDTMSPVVDPLTGDIYLAYGASVAGAGTADIRTAVYSGGSWTNTTDVATNQNTITNLNVAFDRNTADVYVAYMRGTAGTATDAYYKKSTSGMSLWGSETQFSTTTGDLRWMYLNFNSDQRVYGVYEQNTSTTDALLGDTITDLSPPTYTQSAYRLYNNQNSTDIGTPLANQDTAGTLTNSGDAFRLRLLLHVGGDGARANLNDFKLQYAQMSGSCDTGFTGESYTDVTTGTSIAFHDNASPTDGAALTTNANDPTHSTDTVVAQAYTESNTFTNNQAKIVGGQDGLWDISLIDNGAPTDTAYCFRVVRSDGSTLDAYNIVPQVITGGGVTISVSITSDGVISYGTLVAGASKDTTASGMNDTQTILNDGSVAEDLTIKGQDTACPWTLGTSAGTDQYVQEFSTNSGSGWTALTTSYQTLASSIASSGTQDIDLRVTVPTSTNCYSPQSVDVTVQATQS